MTNRIEITEVFEIPAYFLATNPEGCRGWNLVARTTEGRIRTEWLYTGLDTEGAAVCFENESFMFETIDAIHEKGSINPKFWTPMTSEDLDAPPDYVLNPHRPEYN